MTCIYCHNTIKDGAKFCRFCGKTLTSDSNIPPSPVPAWNPDTLGLNAVICPFCFTENVYDAKICRYCSREIPAPAIPQVPTPVRLTPSDPVLPAAVQDAPPTVMSCPHCGKAMTTGEKYCSHCGKPPKPADKKNKTVAVILALTAAVLAISVMLQQFAVSKLRAGDDPGVSIDSGKDDPAGSNPETNPNQQAIGEEERREGLLRGASACYVGFYQTYLTSINTGDFSLDYCSDDVYNYMLSRYTVNSTYSFNLESIYLELETVQNGTDDSFVCTFKNVMTATNKATGVQSANEAVYTVEMVLDADGRWVVNRIQREKDGADGYKFSANNRLVWVLGEGLL